MFGAANEHNDITMFADAPPPIVPDPDYGGLLVLGVYLLVMLLLAAAAVRVGRRLRRTLQESESRTRALETEVAELRDQVRSLRSPQ